MHIDGEPGETQDVDFDAAFAEFADKPASARETADTSAPGEEASAAADEAAADKAGADAPAQAADPWANATPEQVAERDRLIGERDRAVHSDHSQRGRVAALQRNLDNLRSIAAPLTPPADKAGKGGTATDESKDEASAKKERLTKLREEYPDVAEPILDALEAERSRVDRLEAQAQEGAIDREAAKAAAQFQALADKHPDYPDFMLDGKERKSFDAWLAEQPPSVKAMNLSDEAADNTVLLSLYKGERDKAVRDHTPPGATAATDARRSRQLDGARVAGSRPAPAAAGAPDDFDDAFTYWAGRKAKAKG